MNTPYMSIKEVAEYFSIGKSTVYRFIAERKIPHTKIFGNIRIKRTDIETIEKENHVRAKRKGAF